MTVREYALRQIHWMLQKDPWVQEVFLAGGGTLDELAERILAISRFENFELLNKAQVEYYEKMMGLEGNERKPLEDRRAAIQSAWQAAQKPSLATIQAICDAWKSGGILASYVPGIITLKFLGEPGIPANINDLKKSMERVAPAHLVLDYFYRTLLIREVHNVMTLAELAETLLNKFDGE